MEADGFWVLSGKLSPASTPKAKSPASNGSWLPCGSSSLATAAHRVGFGKGDGCRQIQESDSVQAAKRRGVHVYDIVRRRDNAVEDQILILVRSSSRGERTARRVRRLFEFKQRIDVVTTGIDRDNRHVGSVCVTRPRSSCRRR